MQVVFMVLVLCKLISIIFNISFRFCIGQFHSSLCVTVDLISKCLVLLSSVSRILFVFFVLVLSPVLSQQQKNGKNQPRVSSWWSNSVTGNPKLCGCWTGNANFERRGTSGRHQMSSVVSPATLFVEFQDRRLTDAWIDGTSWST